MRQMRLRKVSKPAAGFVVIALAGLLAVMFAMSGPVQASESAEVAVMPFVKGRDPQDPGKSLTCPFGRLCFEKAGLSENADRILTEMAQQILVSRLEHRVVPLGIVRKAYEARMYDPMKVTPLNLARELGLALGVEYVLTGNVWRFKERVGGPYGVQEPASVAFALHLIKTESGNTVWQATFNETQQPLSENLLQVAEFFRRGAKWLTARDLAEYGMKDLMQRFPLAQDRRRPE